MITSQLWADNSKKHTCIQLNGKLFTKCKKVHILVVWEAN